MNSVNYTYNAVVTKVIDGDTIEVNIDLGFRIWTKQRVRVLGINTPEVFTGTATERAAGKTARDVTQTWCLSTYNNVVITTSKSDSVGRWLADVNTPDGTSNLTQHLLDAGYDPYTS